MTQTCIICNEKFSEYGNNPDPVATEGRCCDSCNATVVIPARLSAIMPVLQDKNSMKWRTNSDGGWPKDVDPGKKE